MFSDPDPSMFIPVFTAFSKNAQFEFPAKADALLNLPHVLEGSHKAKQAKEVKIGLKNKIMGTQ